MSPFYDHPVIELRDPVHGAIAVGSGELAVIDSPLFQRLRHVKQLGFGEYVFPGAVHHRYLHSIGAMHLAGQVASRALAFVKGLSDPGRRRLVQRARLAALLHDVGHPPLSHAAESLLPTRGALLGPEVADPDARASHEDVSNLVLTASPLAEALDAAFAAHGVSAREIAAIIDEAHPPIHEDGLDFGPLMHALVSGELDVDRMDYLLRDSYFAGVQYGIYDRDWILSNVRAVDDGGVVHLGLDVRAVPSFEHFLLARYHMFQMVYYHPISDSYDATLRRWLASVGPEARFPASLSEYVHCTDAWLRARLEASSDPWARRVVERRPFTLLVELRTAADRELGPTIRDALAGAGVEAIGHTAKPVLSRYAQTPAELRRNPLIVVDARPLVGRGPRHQRIEDVTDLFDRYERVRRVERLYVAPEEKGRAREVLAALGDRLADSPRPLA
ncbi:MAG: HD domain-containing protein [Deltaproteobacteria bacterium]|nr:HD domain-containing protein [Deltaproteobacteria bacterium]